MCAEWRESFGAFLRDVGARPSPQHSIDRIDNDGHYEPGNVRWANTAQQNNNRRSSRYVIINGQRFTIADAAKKYALDYRSFWRALRKSGAQVDFHGLMIEVAS